MRTSKSVLLLLMVTALVTFFTYSEVWAVADGNGSCSEAELANHDCDVMGGFPLEFLGTFTGICPVDVGTAACSGYFYKYSGEAQNQLINLFPLKLAQVVSVVSNELGSCSQFDISGTGDPTTGFGVNQENLAMCRIAASLTNPSDIVTPPGANIALFTDLSFHDPSMPQAWQLRLSKSKVYAGLVNGPTTLTEPIFQTGVTFTSAEGDICTVNETGVVNCPNAREVTLDQAIFCVEIEECAIADACVFPAEYECDQVVHSGEDMVLKMGFNTNCWIGPYGGRYYFGDYC